MSSGAKGSTTTTQKMDPKALAMIKEMSDFGKEVAKMPYMPWTGNDVAAITPQQTAGMQSFADMGNEFGMGMPTDVSQGMPTATKDASGAWGYSAHPAYLAGAAGAANENPLAAKRYANFYDMNVKDLFGGADPKMPDDPKDRNNNGGGGQTTDPFLGFMNGGKGVGTRYGRSSRTSTPITMNSGKGPSMQGGQ